MKAFLLQLSTSLPVEFEYRVRLKWFAFESQDLNGLQEPKGQVRVERQYGSSPSSFAFES